MTLYILDTDVLINASKNREPDRTWLLGRIREGAAVGITAVTVAEFYSGVKPGDHPRMDSLIEQLGHVPITHRIGITAGSYRYGFARQGVNLSTADCLIAAVATDSGSTLVTHNIKHYPMPGISLLEP
jgi:predicted nucleic acid-binding protein